MGFKKAELGNVSFSIHALDAILDRFGREVSVINRGIAKPTRKMAYNFGMSRLLQSKFISEIWDAQKDKTDRLFANGSMVFVLDEKNDHVITVYDRKYVDRMTLGLVEDILADKVEELNRQAEDFRLELIATEATLELYESLHNQVGGFDNEVATLRGDVARSQLAYDDFRRHKSAVAKSISVLLA